MTAAKPPPSMQELDRFAERFLDTKLPALFALPLLPAVIFSSWALDSSKMPEDGVIEAPDDNGAKPLFERESEITDMGHEEDCDNPMPLFISITASLSFSKMDYGSLVYNSVKLSQFRILLQSLLSSASSLPLSSIAINSISKGSVIVSVTFDFPSSAFSYSEAKEVVEGIIARAGEIFSGSFAKEFSISPPTITLLQPMSLGKGEEAPSEVEVGGNEENRPYCFTRKSEDGLQGFSDDLKVPKLSFPISNAKTFESQMSSHRSAESIGQALVDMADGMERTGSLGRLGSINDEMDDSTIKAAGQGKPL